MRPGRRVSAVDHAKGEESMNAKKTKAKKKDGKKKRDKAKKASKKTPAKNQVAVTLDDGNVTFNCPTLTVRRKGKTSHTITWVPSGEGEPFRFICLHFLDADAPMSDIKVNKKKITCKDKIKSGVKGDDWPYVVAVMDDHGGTHSSGTGLSGEGGRGVIRNEK
jgi:hypothetical protein